jgi:hypothetical protein
MGESGGEAPEPSRHRGSDVRMSSQPKPQEDYATTATCAALLDGHEQQ